jgi:thioredoxin 2
MYARRSASAADAATAGYVLCPRCHCLNRLPADRPAEKAKCGACHEPLFAGRATPVDEAGFEKHLAKDDIAILVDMWAPWCGPCRAMAPMFERAAQRLEPAVRLLKLNVDEAQRTASRLGVRGIPALFLFRNGRVLGQMTGVQDAESIVRWARAHLHSPTSAQGG